MDTTNHPCFDGEAAKTAARVHLPVAVDCNAQCNYCDRKFDCVNESRPGVTSAILSPGQALEYLETVVEKRPDLTVVGIAGPGDPMANPDETLSTLAAVRHTYPDLLLCLATNGLALPEYVDEVAELGVSHVTVTVNAITPEVLGKVYSWIRVGSRRYAGIEAGKMMARRQEEAVRRLAEKGVTIKINTILLPGVNDAEVGKVAEKAALWGAKIMNCIPLLPIAGTPFASLKTADSALVQGLRGEASKYLPQMAHCMRCRADAVGKLGEGEDGELTTAMNRCASVPDGKIVTMPDPSKPYVAVASMEGVYVNQHLGEADRIGVYRLEDEAFELVEMRETPPKGGGMERWKALAEKLSDCRAILVGGVGGNPREVLEASGIKIIEMEGLLEDGLEYAFRDEEIPATMSRKFRGCGLACKGSGGGCAA
jgi:nitrogen fixation protein NifB